MMRHKISRHRVLILLLPGALLLLALNLHIGYAEPSTMPRTDAYEIAWYTIAGGGGQELTGGDYSLEGTLGQFDAGAESGGSYSLNGGFWLRADFFGNQSYLPLTIR